MSNVPAPDSLHSPSTNVEPNPVLMYEFGPFQLDPIGRHLLKEGEVVVFGWVTFKNRKHRDAVMKKVFADPFMKNYDPKTMPFDGKRMFWGGFKPFVSY